MVRADEYLYTHSVCMYICIQGTVPILQWLVTKGGRKAGILWSKAGQWGDDFQRSFGYRSPVMIRCVCEGAWNDADA